MVQSRVSVQGIICDLSPEDLMKQAVGALTFLVGLVVGLVGGAALLAYAYQAAGLYPPDDATIKFIARERGWLKDDV
jgi:hypothetical protein